MGLGYASAYGIVIVDPYSHPDATIQASLFNNIVTNTSTGIVLSEDDQLAVRGDLNNTFNVPNGDILGSYDLGTTLHDDPLYTSATNFRLQEASPLRNAGRTCMASLPLPRGDAARMFRLTGSAVDIGAYEYGSTLSSAFPGRNITGTGASQTLVGTGGLDVLCAMGGNDVVDGKGKRDYIYGGSGNDRVSGGDGNDFLNVKDGVTSNDRVNGGAGTDKCVIDTGDVKQACE